MAIHKKFVRSDPGMLSRPLISILALVFIGCQIVLVGHAYSHAPTQQDVACEVCVQGSHGGLFLEVAKVVAVSHGYVVSQGQPNFSLAAQPDLNSGSARSPPALLINS